MFRAFLSLAIATLSFALMVWGQFWMLVNIDKRQAYGDRGENEGMDQDGSSLRIAASPVPSCLASDCDKFFRRFEPGTTFMGSVIIVYVLTTGPSEAIISLSRQTLYRYQLVPRSIISSEELWRSECTFII
ncbi:hypothetical protein B0H15DRAFT_854185 [Mycena belliarum]|uniref:Uncharacterized protein n=1 Tax=Mycena belliarum TaxID=1033014 RepID=A0AAD6U1G3_9AGAR|nr:hypothetical protein B0H15DRAFT_854185 [Mycena belliae]